jgi:hypothetical protein
MIRRMASPNTCAECSRPFTATKSYQRFCSRRCQKDAGCREERQARALLRAVRLVLGKEREAA